MEDPLRILNPPVIVTKENKKNDTLKLVGIVLMIIDHIGLAFFPNIIAFRIIGRLAFPIFAYGIAMGYTYSKNVNRYMLRLSAFALVSEPIFHLIIPKGLNIFFTLLIGLICIIAIDKKRYVILALVLGLSYFLPLDYGLYGVLTIIAFYVFKNNINDTLIALLIINGIYALQHNTLIQCLSLFSLLLIYKKWTINLQINKYFGYAFYPCHLLIIAIVKILIK